MGDKKIWTPSTQTKVIIGPDGSIRIWDEITMNLKSIKKELGFPNDSGRNSD